MPAPSKEPAVMVKELPPDRDSEDAHHRPRRRKAERASSDDKHGVKRRTRSSTGENVRHASDVTVPFLWRWASDNANASKKIRAREETRPTSGQEKGSHTSGGNRSEHRRRLEETSSGGHIKSRAATVTRGLKVRPVTTRSSSHPVQPASATSLSPTSRPPLRRSKTTTRTEISKNHPSPSTPKPERRDRTDPATKKSKTSSSVFANTAKPKKPVKMVECVSCMDDIPAKKGAYLKYCQHHWCESCIKAVFELSVKDIQQMPPKCCKGKPIQPNAVNHLFDSTFRIAWNKKYQEWSSKDRIYCPRKSCGTWIKPEHIKEDKNGNKIYGECSKCKKKVCPKCNGNYHPKRSDCPKDPEIDKFIKAVKENGWQQCPKCSITVERSEGCNHMTCPPPCRHEFCIVCAMEWKTCDCPIFGQEEINRQARLAGMGLGGPVMPAPQTHAEEIARRRDQERRDEEFARRMQMLGMDDDLPGPMMDPFQARPGGGGGRHAMNMPPVNPFGMNAFQPPNFRRDPGAGGGQVPDFMRDPLAYGDEEMDEQILAWAEINFWPLTPVNPEPLIGVPDDWLEWPPEIKQVYQLMGERARRETPGLYAGMQGTQLALAHYSQLRMRRARLADELLPDDFGGVDQGWERDRQRGFPQYYQQQQRDRIWGGVGGGR